MRYVRAFLVLVGLGLLSVSVADGQEQSHLPAVLDRTLDRLFPKATIRELKTRHEKHGFRFEAKLVDADNPKPFKVVVNGKGAVVEESEHILSLDLVPASLLSLCDFLKKDKSGWRVKTKKGRNRSFKYRSGKKRSFLQMYGVSYGSIDAYADSENQYSGTFEIWKDTGMARGSFRLDLEGDGNHELTLILKERRGNAYSFLEEVAGKATLPREVVKEPYETSEGLIPLRAKAAQWDPGLVFRWTQKSGPKATILKADQPSAWFRPTRPGTYVFAFTVTDGKDTATATVKKIVKRMPP